MQILPHVLMIVATLMQFLYAKLFTNSISLNSHKNLRK